MIKLSATIDIEAPIQQVFSVFADVKRKSEIVGCIDHVELLDSDRARVGQKWRETTSIGDGQFSTENEVVAYEKPSQLITRNTSGGITTDTVYAFKKISESQTRVTMSAGQETKAKGFLAKVMLALIGTKQDPLSEAFFRHIEMYKECIEKSYKTGAKASK